MLTLVVAILIISSLMVLFQTASSFSDKIEQIRSQLSQLTEQHARLEADGQTEEAEKLRSELAQLNSDLRMAERDRGRDFMEDKVRGRMDRRGEDPRDRFRDRDDERMHPRDHRGRHGHNPRQSKEEMENEKHERFHNLIKGRYDEMKSQLNSLDFTSDDRSSLLAEVEKFYRLERDVMDGRRDTSREFEKARDIHEKDARRAHLDKVRNQRETERDGHMSKRDEARAIRDKVMKAIEEKKRGVEL